MSENLVKINKAILLSAGYGTRLKPITDNLPKCLVPINGVPLLQIWLEHLSQAGINEFLINTHYLAPQVVEFIANSPYQSQVTLVHEPVLLGTVGTLKANQAFWQNDNVLIAHADNLCLLSWPKFFRQFKQRPSDCIGTMMLFESDDPRSCGVVTLDQQQRLLEFFEKVAQPPTNLANGAVYLFDPNLASFVEKLSKQQTDISIDLMPLLLGKINTWLNDGYLRDIGNVASLAKAERFMTRYANK
ncbi:MAG: nucleotidyltransferase family protein [Thalassotalea sp.]